MEQARSAGPTPGWRPLLAVERQDVGGRGTLWQRSEYGAGGGARVVTRTQLGGGRRRRRSMEDTVLAGGRVVKSRRRGERRFGDSFLAKHLSPSSVNPHSSGFSDLLIFS
jgi:hypothetical protein